MVDFMGEGEPETQQLRGYTLIKQGLEIEERRIRERLAKLKAGFKNFDAWSGYLVTPQQFEQLKEFSDALGGRMPGDKTLDGICEHCRPIVPTIAIDRNEKYSSGCDVFYAAPSFSSITLGLTLDVSEKAVLRKIRKLYDYALKIPEDGEGDTRDRNPRRIFLNTKKEYLLELIEQGLVKRERQMRIIQKDKDNSYTYLVCKDCENKGVIGKMEKDTTHALKSYYHALGLNSRDYTYQLRVDKEVKWDPNKV